MKNKQIKWLSIALLSIGLLGTADARARLTMGSANDVPVFDKSVGKAVIDTGNENIDQWEKQKRRWEDYIEELRSKSIGGDYTSDYSSVIETALLGAEAGTDDAAAKRFLGDEETTSCGLPNDGAVYKVCIKERNLKAQHLADMEELLKNLDERNKELNELVKSWTDNMRLGEVQDLQFKMAAYQAKIQNDMTRVQLNIAMYKQRQELFAQEHADKAYIAIHGEGKPLAMDSVFSKLFGF